MNYKYIHIVICSLKSCNNNYYDYLKKTKSFSVFREIHSLDR